METGFLHASAPAFSRIMTGVWRWHTVSTDVVERLIHTSLDLGMTSFDHADIYGDHSNEAIFGDVLRRNPALRQRMQLITKCGIKFRSQRRPATRIKHYDTSSDHIVWSVENSLKMLNTDHIDVLLLHRPNPLLDPDEVAAAFSQLHAEGKVNYFGVSNFTPAQFSMLQSRLKAPLITNQIEISLGNHASLFNGDLDFLMERRVSPMAWSPLGGGKAPDVEERLIFSMAAKHNATYQQLLLAWLLKHPAHIFPIMGTTRPERLEEAAKSLEIRLDVQDWFEMLEWVRRKEVP